jgi:hypothetical protein
MATSQLMAKLAAYRAERLGGISTNLAQGFFFPSAAGCGPLG